MSNPRGRPPKPPGGLESTPLLPKSRAKSYRVVVDPLGGAPRSLPGVAAAQVPGGVIGPSAPVTDLGARSLPPAWAMVSTDDHPFRRLLPHIERMAAQGMTILHIANRLGMSSATLTEAMDMYRDVEYAFKGGDARGLDEVSEQILDAGVHGDVGAGKFRLQMGGYNKPAPAVVQQLGAGTRVTTVSMTTIEDMADAQRRMPSVVGLPPMLEHLAEVPAGDLTPEGPQGSGQALVDALGLSEAVAAREEG